MNPKTVAGCAISLFMTLAGSAGGDELKSALTADERIAAAAVHVAAAGLGGALKDIKDKPQQIKLIADFIAPIRFYPDKTGYFYVYDFECVNVAHATQSDLVGKNLYDHKDTKGKFVIRELAAAAKKGGGFVQFYWAKPGDTGEHKKMGYVEPIPGTDFFIGAGVYLPE